MGIEDEFDRLETFAILDRDLIALEDRNGAASAPRHGMTLHARRQNRKAGNNNTGPFEWSFKDDLHNGPAVERFAPAIAADR